MSAKSKAAALIRTGTTPEARSKRMSLVANARWKKATPEDRKRSAQIMVEARRRNKNA